MAYKYITNYTSPNFTPASQAMAVWGKPRTIEILAQHWWGDPATNPTFEGVIATLCNPSRQASAHFVSTGNGRRVAQLVELEDASWATNQANPYSISIEADPRCTDEDYDVLAELIADLWSYYGYLPVKPHNAFVATACPGNYDIARIEREAQAKLPYAKQTSDFGQINIPQPKPAPVQPAPVDPEWIRNLKDIEDLKLTVLNEQGTRVINLNTLAPLNDVIIPKGTNMDIAKETTIGDKKFYITSYSAERGISNGVLASDLGTVVSEKEKPEWMKNLKDIEDIDMWTRSETPVLSIEDSKTLEKLPMNSKVRVIKSTNVFDKDMFILDGEKTMVDIVYLSDKPVIVAPEVPTPEVEDNPVQKEPENTPTLPVSPERENEKNSPNQKDELQPVLESEMKKHTNLLGEIKSMLSKLLTIIKKIFKTEK